MIRKHTEYRWKMMLIVGILCAATLFAGVYTRTVSADIYPVTDRSRAGSVVLRAAGLQTVAELFFNDQKPVIQAASIVRGTCEHPGEELYHLTYVFTGRSNTTLHIPFIKVFTFLPAAVIIRSNTLWDSSLAYCGQLHVR